MMSSSYGFTNSGLHPFMVALEIKGANPVDAMAITRMSNCLANLGVWTVQDLLKLTRKDLMSIPNMGKKSVDFMHAALVRRGLPSRLGLPAQYTTGIGELDRGQ